MCIYADDLLDTDIENWPQNRGDEDMIVIDLPQRLHRCMYSTLQSTRRQLGSFSDSTLLLTAVIIFGEALGAHFQYSGQPKLAETDILTRYSPLAQDQSL